MLSIYVLKVMTDIPAKSRKLARDYARSDSGIAALEFALIFPVFLILFYGVAEISNYNFQKRRGQMAIDFAIEFLSRDDNNNMTVQERYNALDIWAIVNPTAKDATNTNNGRQSHGYSRTYAAVEFEPTPVGCFGMLCSYEPKVLWTFKWTGGGAVQSPLIIDCDVSVVANGTKFDGKTIPEGMLGRTAILMGGYTYRYEPLLNNQFIPETDVDVTAIRKTRGNTALVHPNGKQCG